mmetsp:Transcript_57207/g.114693  ORF Transcript_57207/g.114693 Transcript_57207/m.114693 type:complete len:520 (-) Transcript_57207:157-1716(-)|eukprot:CAMPEP_0113818424 /NCGR_PEP_ID=MMETSP0328-20130328/233_1 /TAXON_ID=39455 /ORGANISM="Alexandrium minutum" /LENGTH=519 /DNA_ID=CAMNT_0000786359 /DNA_START=92 /DNA_END=1651 /DNA_ORIENTATION=- /assembly_acc=CAM_ASM_000350
MPPKGMPTLTREQLISLEDEMIEAYRDPEFQKRLHAAWDAAQGDNRAQIKARQEVCLPAQLAVITKYGFEASMRGVNHSVSMYTKLKSDADFAFRGETLNWLIHPGLQRLPRRVDFIIGPNQYTIEQVVPDYTLGYFKRQLEEGILGSKVLYANTLVCERESSRQTLEDHHIVPSSPDRLSINKPASVAKMLEIALRSKVGEPLWSPRIGDFRVKRSIGRGAAGVCVYLVEHLFYGLQGALKWPAKPEEAHAMLDLHKRLPKGYIGVPQLLAYGCYEEKQYIVTPMLGATLVTDFRLMQALQVDERWQALCVIGRIVLQRLETIHSCGFVHCDMSPENVLHGTENNRNTLFLIDYGLARRYPGGRPLRGDFGSAEWSSIRSAEGGERRPEDDLEALGWVLAHGLVGEAPWVKTLREAYPEFGSVEKREYTIKQVQLAKAKLLESGWENMGSEYELFGDIPEELWTFLRACRTKTVAPALPNYARLHVLLGAPEHCDPMEAEKELQAWILPWLRQAAAGG